jgi:hypothetical protein
MTWLFTTPLIPRAASQRWRILNKSTHWIRAWINWYLGTSRSITLGTERILGLDPSSFLSLSLLAHLHNKGIHFLYQASNHNQLETLTLRLISGSTLELASDLIVEWTNFYGSLYSAGVFLHNKEDRLLWTGRDCTGHISIAKKNSTIINSANIPNITGLCKRLWKWKIPLKVKLFTWLVDKNKISSWDNLLRKGWNNPNNC